LASTTLVSIVARVRRKKKSNQRRGPNYGRATPPKHLRSDHDDEFEMNGVRLVRDSRTTTLTTTSEFDRERLAAQVRARAVDATVRSTKAIDSLRRLSNGVNALHLVTQVATWATMGGARRDDAEARFGLEAQAEFLTAVAVESGLPHGPLAGPDEVGRALALLDDLFEAEHDRILGEMMYDIGEPRPIDEVRLVTRLEALSDRTQGYVPHLTKVIHEIFEPIRRECIETVGFSPADIPQLIAIYSAERQKRFDRLLDVARHAPIDPDLQASPMLIRIAWVLFTLNDPSGDIDPVSLAENAGLPAEQVVAIFDAMATPWGQPPSELRPGEVYTVRRRPALHGPAGTFAWPLPWSSLHEALPWFGDVAAGHPELRVAYQNSRAEAAEHLAADGLSRVFGEERVHRKFEYPIGAGNWAECDIVVCLPGHALAVEVKSGALDDMYRSGDAEYAASTHKTLVDDPFRQSARAADFLRSGNRFRTHGSKERHEWVAVSDVTRVAVSLERIDALAFASSRIEGATDGQGATWVVCLADLLMVVDILDNPHAFFAYAQVRAALAADPIVAVISEADLLGAFLHDRLKLLRRSVARRDGPTVASLGHHSHQLNEYFTPLAAGAPTPRRPSLKLKAAVHKELRHLFATSDPSWADTALRLVVRS
jgi:hypothetical protein